MGLMDDAIPDRYEHNPMLVVIENYVLDAIGKLDAASAAKLNAMICQTFGGTDWKKTVREQFDLPADSDETLRGLWRQAVEEAEETQQDVSPEAFAREMADDLVKDVGGM